MLQKGYSYVRLSKTIDCVELLMLSFLLKQR